MTPYAGEARRPFEVSGPASGVRAERAGDLRLPRGQAQPDDGHDDLIIYKLVASRPRDIEDVERLVAAHRDVVDIEHISRAVAEFSGLLDDHPA
jgi:hypothetical protein